MISRVQTRAVSQPVVFSGIPRLTAVEKGMLRWITVDPRDRVLDAGISSGLAAEYLCRNMQCEVCGLSSSMEKVRRARERLTNCDIIYGGAGEIPWHDASFDIVMFSGEDGDSGRCRSLLRESFRVLREGGELVLGLKTFPRIGYGETRGEEESLPAGKKSLLALLEGLGFHHCSWIRTGLTTAVVVGWKPGLPS